MAHIFHHFSIKDPAVKLASILRTYSLFSLCHLYCKHYTTTITNECTNVKVVLLLIMLFFTMPLKVSARLSGKGNDGYRKL